MSDSMPLPVTTREFALRLSRRRFIRLVLGLSGISAIAALIACSKPPAVGPGERVLAGTLNTLPVGAGTVVGAGSGPAIVVNTEQGVKAYSAICTHATCIVTWDDAANQISCPCHVAFFDPVTGAVVSGPPPAPLPPLTTVIEGQDIYVIAT
jgi:nitrite reductase/ring-hydroxylating ferredoxin subunit